MWEGFYNSVHAMFTESMLDWHAANSGQHWWTTYCKSRHSRCLSLSPQHGPFRPALAVYPLTSTGCRLTDQGVVTQANHLCHVHAWLWMIPWACQGRSNGTHSRTFRIHLALIPAKPGSVFRSAKDDPGHAGLPADVGSWMSDNQAAGNLTCHSVDMDLADTWW